VLEPEVYKRTVTFPVNPEDSQLVDLNFVRACLAVAVKHLGLVEQVAKLPASKQARAAESDSCWGPEDCVPANPAYGRLRGPHFVRGGSGASPILLHLWLGNSMADLW